MTGVQGLTMSCAGCALLSLQRGLVETGVLLVDTVASQECVHHLVHVATHLKIRLNTMFAGHTQVLAGSLLRGLGCGGCKHREGFLVGTGQGSPHPPGGMRASANLVLVIVKLSLRSHEPAACIVHHEAHASAKNVGSLVLYMDIFVYICTGWFAKVVCIRLGYGWYSTRDLL